MGDSSSRAAAPGGQSVRGGPPITLACDCGQREQVAYGTVWTCPGCARRWDTAKIPMQEYLALRAIQRRFRRVPMAIALVGLACVIVAVAAGRALGGMIVVVVMATSWRIIGRPMFGRRYRAALAQRPTWTLAPEPADDGETRHTDR